MAPLRLGLLLLPVAGTGATGNAWDVCPGNLAFEGLGSVSLVPAGWGSKRNMSRLENGAIQAEIGSRTYFADGCTAGVYEREQYLALDLRGKTLSYTTDFSKAGCGCNAAFYLASLHQNRRKSDCHDYYCDANNVCGESCAEIDIQEANRFAWHSTLHSFMDPAGYGKGYGGGGQSWSGPRQWSHFSYGPRGRCIDTNLPFRVAVSFPVTKGGKLRAMEVTLSQPHHACNLSLSLEKYRNMAELDFALQQGMTPIVSYWRNSEMLWMDGRGADFKGPCARDEPEKCGASVIFSDFAVTPAFPLSTRTVTTTTVTTTTTTTQEPFALPAWSNFLLGIGACLLLEALCVLGVWASRSSEKRIIGSPPPPAPANKSPLADSRPTSASSSCLLLEAGDAATVPAPPTA